MAQHFKAHVVNSDQYPLPEPVLPLAPAGHAAGDAQGVTAEQLQPHVGELQRLQQTVAEMRDEIEGLAAFARANAVEQGYNEGQAAARAEVSQHIMEAVATLTGAQRERHAIAQQHQAALARLSLSIAQKVVGEHVALDPSIVARIVESTIAELEPSTTLTVHANPADVPALQAHQAALDRLLAGTGSVGIVPDESVGRGGCVLVSPVGEVDARIETKIAVLETAFEGQQSAPAATAEAMSTEELGSELGF